MIGWPSRKPAFDYPIPPAPRTAVLIPGFRSNGRVRVFAQGWSAKVAKFAPQSIAATLAQFEAIAATEISLTHATIVVGRFDDPRVREADRERLWARFKVPVFEQIVESGILIAAECEAHCGLHVVEPNLFPAGVSLDESACGCGRTSSRLIVVEDSRAVGA